MTSDSDKPWRWANDSPVWLKPRRTVYFLVRDGDDGRTEYRTNKRGHVITYRDREQAIRIEQRLNAATQRSKLK